MRSYSTMPPWYKTACMHERTHRSAMRMRDRICAYLDANGIKNPGKLSMGGVIHLGLHLLEDRIRSMPEGEPKVPVEDFMPWVENLETPITIGDMFEENGNE